MTGYREPAKPQKPWVPAWRRAWWWFLGRLPSLIALVAIAAGLGAGFGLFALLVSECDKSAMERDERCTRLCEIHHLKFGWRRQDSAANDGSVCGCIDAEQEKLRWFSLDDQEYVP